MHKSYKTLKTSNIIYYSLILLVYLFLPNQQAFAYEVNPGCTPSTGPYYGKLRLNEVKSQGGGAGLQYVEIYTLDNAVDLDNFKLGLSGNSNTSSSDNWVELNKKDPSAAILNIATGKGCVDFTGDKNQFASCPIKDNSNSAVFNYGRYILYDLPSMSSSGQIVLLDENDKIVDFVSYSDNSTTCDASLFWTPPATTSSCYNVHNCVTGFASSDSSIGRNVDGTGEWTNTGTTTTQGDTNTPTAGLPTNVQTNGVGYKYEFAPTCLNGNVAVTITAYWIDINSNFIIPKTIYTPASSTVNLSTTTPNIIIGSGTLVAGVGTFALTGSAATFGSAVSLTAVNPSLPGTLSTGTITLANCGSHHIQIEHDGNGLTCTPENIILKACADESCTTTNSNISVTFKACVAASCSSSVININASGTATVPVKQTTAAIVTLSTEGVDYVCKDTSTNSNSCAVSFEDSGFILTLPDHISCTEQTLSVAAVRTNDVTKQCIPAFSDKIREVKFSRNYDNPNTGSKNAWINNIEISDDTAVNLTFNASGVATPSFIYDDVGRLTISANYTGTSVNGDTGLIMQGSKSVVVAPKSLVITPSIIGSDTSYIAGKPFKATISAINNCSVPTSTANFGKELPSVAIALTHERTVPPDPTIITDPQPDNGVLTPGTYTLVSNTPTFNDINWSEVGNIKMTATITNYLGSNLSANGTSNSFGLFIPAYFDTEVSSGCAAFTYSGLNGTSPKIGQPFTVKVKAKRFGGDATDSTNTKNYANIFGLANAVTLSDANSSTVGTLVSGNLAAADFTNGIGIKSSVSYNFNNILTIPYSLTIRAVDNTYPTYLISSSGHNEGSTEIRSGRLRLYNKTNSPSTNMSMPMQAQYWNGLSWVSNANDDCTLIPATAISIAGYTGAVTSSNLSLTGSSYALTDGNGNLTLAAPNATGTAQITINLTNFPWLLGGPNNNQNPSARASFGIYTKEHKKSIYTRELF